MTQQIDERQARKTYVRHRQTIVFSISGVVLAAILVVAILFNFHVFAWGGLTHRPPRQTTAMPLPAPSRAMMARQRTWPMELSACV